LKRLRTIALWLLLPLAAGAAIAFAIGWIASLTAPVGPNAGYMIVPGKPEWEVQGTVAVGVAQTRWRTDLLLDPGPYTREERGSQVLYPTSANRSPLTFLMTSSVPPPPSLERPAPPWVRDVALDHAGERFKGWQARVAAFGWPHPVVYWLWDWRTESVQGGVVTDKAAKAAEAASTTMHKAVPEQALPWKLLWRNFALDSALFGGVLGAVAATWAGARRIFRWRRGCCPRCGYVLRGRAAGAVCPECGRVCRAAPCDEELARARAERLRRSLCIPICLLLGAVVSLVLAALQLGVTARADVVPLQTTGAVGHQWEFKAWRGGPLRNSVEYVTLSPPKSADPIANGLSGWTVSLGPVDPADLSPESLRPILYDPWRAMLRESALTCTTGSASWVLAAWGLPMRCLAGGVMVSGGVTRSWYVEFDIRGHKFRLPTHPIWTGLAIDSIVAGALLALAWRGAARLLGRRRSRAGLGETTLIRGNREQIAS
jgi:hypothetical protein